MYQTEKVLAEEAKEMRAVFAEVMEELAQQDGRVVYLDADIINSIGMTGFWKAHPERTVNCGIQEANMIGAAVRDPPRHGAGVPFCGLRQAECTHYRF